ncbi:MAG: TetR/AcrR family transcriptional regulator [Bowdeniella nasicola]|nr:TetR/AcrR family transcriptional regulator [Bowdeniella nasicola]
MKEQQLRRRENTREKIIAAAADVFATKGILGTTVDDLTASAGFTRGAFYSNFSTKEEVFEASVSRLLERIGHTAVEGSRHVRPDSDPFGALERLFTSLRGDMRLLWRIELEASVMALRNCDLRATYGAIRGALRKLVAEILTETLARDDHRLRVDADVAADSIIALYFNALTAAELEGRDTLIAATIPSLVAGLVSADEWGFSHG